MVLVIMSPVIKPLGNQTWLERLQIAAHSQVGLVNHARVILASICNFHFHHCGCCVTQLYSKLNQQLKWNFFFFSFQLHIDGIKSVIQYLRNPLLDQMSLKQGDSFLACKNMRTARETRLMRQLLESNKLNSLHNWGLRISWENKLLQSLIK